MTILLLKGYNNYFNRIRKKETSITAYKEASTSYLEYPNVNFDPQDGILTSLVVGSEVQKVDIVNGQSEVIGQEVLKFDDLGCPDYLICHDNQTIKSRWFIMESVKITQGQYKLALKRDVLIDYGESIMNSPCFVEKGNITDFNDPLLLNPENMSFNQRKTGEKLLRDNTYCAWLVGYLKKDMNESKTITYTFPATVPNSVALDSFPWANCVDIYNLDGTSTSSTKTASKAALDSSYIKFRTWYPSASTLGWVNPKNIRSAFSLNGNLITNEYNKANQDWEGLTSTALDLEEHIPGTSVSIGIAEGEAEKLGKEIFDHTFNWSYVKQYFDTLINATKYTVTSGNNLVDVTEDLTKYNGLLVTKNSKVYRLTVGQGSSRSYDIYYTGEDNNCNDYLSSLYYEPFSYRYLYRNQDNPTKNKVKITLNYQQYQITATEVVLGQTISFTLPVSANRNTCDDAAYDMFAIPMDPNALGFNVAKSNVYVRNGSTSICRVANVTETELAVAMKLMTSEGAGTEAGWVYDLQLLPFCPLGTSFMNKVRVIGPSYGSDTPSDVRLDINGLTEGKDYVWITNNEATPKKRGIVFFPSKANFDVDINVTVDNTHIVNEFRTLEKPTMLYFGHSDDTGYPGDWPLYYIDFSYGSADDSIDLSYNSLRFGGDLLYDLENSNLALLGSFGGNGNQVGIYFVVFNQGNYDPLTTYSPIVYDTHDTTDDDSFISLKTNWILPDGPVERKIQNETDFYRITSPNYNSFYEFKKTKLDGNKIEGLRAICTYKPYTPFIKVNPNLNDSLYSIQDYNDNIGLTLAGDYSIPMISDAMINYELQNRNYQAIFNRSVQNLDLNNRIVREQQEFQGVMNTITAPIGGGAAGALAGAKAGPYGAIAGAVVGAAGGIAASTVGYAKDKEWLQQQQYEARDYAIDNFNYQLGNIQALPQTMTKSTPLSYNNKVWPILESFSCTPKEREILVNKLKWDGMTIMAIGTLSDYTQPGGKLKGQMIRLDDLNDDSHIANAIYEEVNKGFYEGE